METFAQPAAGSSMGRAGRSFPLSRWERVGVRAGGGGGRATLLKPARRVTQRSPLGEIERGRAQGAVPPRRRRRPRSLHDEAVESDHRGPVLRLRQRVDEANVRRDQRRAQPVRQAQGRRSHRPAGPAPGTGGPRRDRPLHLPSNGPPSPKWRRPMLRPGFARARPCGPSARARCRPPTPSAVGRRVRDSRRASGPRRRSDPPRQAT